MGFRPAASASNEADIGGGGRRGVEGKGKGKTSGWKNETLEPKRALPAVKSPASI